METLSELLAREGLRPKHTQPGSVHRFNCPRCADKDKAFSLRIDPDGQGFTGNCKHGSCGHTVGAKVREERFQPHQPRHEYRQPAPIPPDECEPSFACNAWFKRRGISQETVEIFGVYDTARRFGDKGQHDCVVFPYRFNGVTVNRKYRGMQNKGLMMQEPNPMPTLFNIDAIDKSDPDIIVWVEGECDVMAVHEAGYPQVVSLKDGAPAKLKDELDPDDKRFAALSTHHEVLSAARKFILAGDMDGPGEVLREELARRLGRHKCWIVSWPGECKDANDTLLHLGVEAIRTAIEGAEPYPIEGVQQPSEDLLVAHKHMPPPPVMFTGIATVDAILKIPGEGRVIVVTGVPNSGKTNWVLNAMVHLQRKYGRKFAVFSPEAGPWLEFLANVAQILTDKPFYNRGGFVAMDDDDARRAALWFRGKLFWIGGDEEVPTMSWLLDTAKLLVMRYGITDFIIDPFNEVEPGDDAASETKYVGRCLQAARKFGERYGCNVWIVAHPKMMQKDKDGNIGSPGPYDISGSANWANKADLGITIHTPDETTFLILWKSRYSRWGRKNNKAAMKYDVVTGRYYSDAPPMPYQD